MLSSPSDLNLFITVRWVAIVAISGKHEIVLIKIKISVFLYMYLNHVKDPAQWTCVEQVKHETKKQSFKRERRI